MVTFSGEVKNAKVEIATSCPEQEKSWYAVLHFRVIGNCMEAVFLHSCMLSGLVSPGLMSGLTPDLY